MTWSKVYGEIRDLVAIYMLSQLYEIAEIESAKRQKLVLYRDTEIALERESASK